MKPDRENNFNILRLAAALMVMLGHMGAVLGIGVPTLGAHGLHVVGVKFLFLIGGYLVTQSWERDPHPGRYALRRFFRFYPPFAVMVLLMALAAGPLLSNLGPVAYYQGDWYAYLWNLRFFIVYTLPGVFADHVTPAVNGSIWTMPVEALAYVLLALIRSRKKGRISFGLACGTAGLLAALDVGIFLTRETEQLVFYGTDWFQGLHLLAFFAVGSLFTWPQMRRLLNLQTGCLALGAMICAQCFSGAWNEAVALIAMPLFVFSFALTEKPRFAKVGRKYELSYGIYLYGFFFQQLVVSWRQASGASWGFYTCFLISLALTLAAAFLSSALVERPCQALCRRLTAGKKTAG